MNKRQIEWTPKCGHPSPCLFFSILLQPFKWVRCSIEMRLEDMGQSPFLLLWGPLFFAHDTLARLDVLRPDSEGLSLSFRWGIALPFMGWGLQFRVLCWPSAPLWSIFFFYMLCLHVLADHIFLFPKSIDKSPFLPITKITHNDNMNANSQLVKEHWQGARLGVKRFSCAHSLDRHGSSELCAHLPIQQVTELRFGAAENSLTL